MEASAHILHCWSVIASHLPLHTHTNHPLHTPSGSQHDAHSLDWYFTGPLTQLLQGGGQWSPSSDYFHSLVTRLMKGLKPFNIFGPVAEWHFTEFASPMTFALYTALVELMCVPLPGTETVRHLITTAYDKWVVDVF